MKSAVLVVVLLVAPGRAIAQDVPQLDVIDVWNRIRDKEPKPGADEKRRMIAAMPIIGRNPTSGLTFGAAAQLAFIAGDPATTRISSSVSSLSFSTKNEILFNVRFTAYTAGNGWMIEGDNRVNQSGERVYGLGANTPASAAIDADYTFVRVHETAYYRVRGPFYLGAGLLFDSHNGVKPETATDAEWTASSYVAYNDQHGLPNGSQQSGGVSVNALVDRRVGEIDPRRGWMAQAWYRASFSGLFSGDSAWQLAHLEARTYIPLGRQPHSTGAATGAGVPARHRLTLWTFADVTTSGAPPYFDLPATVSDTYGRSSRGYQQGRYRGERIVYGEVEYRGMLTGNGLLGLVAFANTITVTNLASGERLFDSYAPAGGAGLRVLFNKRSRTNLCVDFAVGKAGAKGIYLAIQDAF